MSLPAQIASPTDYLAAYDDATLALGLLSGGMGDGEAEQRVQSWLLEQVDTYMPGWDARHVELLTATDDQGLADVGAELRGVLAPLAALAERTGARPWESSRATTDEILESRQSHPERWLTLDHASVIFRRLDNASRAVRRQIGRATRARGAGRPAGKRRATTSRDDGSDEGPGEPPSVGLDVAIRVEADR